ncbi:hypothetical protein Tco_1582052, partial [Tanacetum coccineum]
MLETTCSGLRYQVSGYELFKEQYEAVQDEQVKVLSDKVVGLDVELMGMAFHLDEEFYPRFLTTIAGRRVSCCFGGAIGRAIDKGMQDGLVAGIDHGKARQGHVDVVAYKASAKANYVFAMNALRAVDFPLLAQLASQKDASIADIMGLLHLEVHGRVQRIRRDAASQRLSISDVMVPLIEPLSTANLVGEASTSCILAAVAATNALSTTFVQASPVP